MQRIVDIFETRKNDSRYNTSYPLSPSDWEPFRVRNELPFPVKGEVSFYIHIPFCHQLCAFCEYTRMSCPDKKSQINYILALRYDIEQWLRQYPDVTLKGFDIGGGTPTSLCDEAFSQLMQIYRDTVTSMKLADDFEPSIEGTFNSLSEVKLKLTSGSGIRRLSLGLQSSNLEVLRHEKRSSVTLEKANAVCALVHATGFEKLNIDLMYGLPGQDIQKCEQDLAWIKQLEPEQVTLYELRTNMVGKSSQSKEELLEQYKTLYEGIIGLGYKGAFGTNTFSKDEKDLGLSSYLRSRMIDAVPYKGFGVSAQSMTPYGISYNVGKGASDIRGLIDSGSFKEEYTYVLPHEELLAKYIAVSGYHGSFSLSTASRVLENDFSDAYGKQLRWCMDAGLLALDGDIVRITEKGFKYYGAVFSLFYH